MNAIKPGKVGVFDVNNVVYCVWSLNVALAVMSEVAPTKPVKVGTKPMLKVVTYTGELLNVITSDAFADCPLKTAVTFPTPDTAPVA